MPKTIRKFWPDPFPIGRNALNFNWDEIDSDSVVLVTAAKYVPQPNAAPDANLQRLLDIQSPLTVRIDNISPHEPPFDQNHGVTSSVTIARPPNNVFEGRTFVATDITLFESKPVETQAG
jgi:hypothetical protein